MNHKKFLGCDEDCFHCKYSDCLFMANLSVILIPLSLPLKSRYRKRLIFRLKAQLVGIQNVIVLIAIVWFRTANIVLIAVKLWILTVMGVIKNENM